jgi:hypothetical protein
MLTTGLLMSEVIKPATAAAAPEPYGMDDALAELFPERSALFRATGACAPRCNIARTFPVRGGGVLRRQ